MSGLSGLCSLVSPFAPLDIDKAFELAKRFEVESEGSVGADPTKLYCEKAIGDTVDAVWVV